MKKAAAKKVTSQRVHELNDGKGRMEFLDLSTPGNRLQLTIESGGRVKPKTRDVTLAESFAWYQGAHDPQWWDDGGPGPAWEKWLSLVQASLVAPVQADTSTQSAEQLVVRPHGLESLLIDANDVLTLKRGDKARVVSVTEALRWWLPTIEDAANGGDVSSDPQGEWQFFSVLTRGIFVPMNDGELAAVRLCASGNTNGNLAEWAREWIACGISADLDDAFPNRKADTN